MCIQVGLPSPENAQHPAVTDCLGILALLRLLLSLHAHGKPLPFINYAHSGVSFIVTFSKSWLLEELGVLQPWRGPFPCALLHAVEV